MHSLMDVHFPIAQISITLSYQLNSCCHFLWSQGEDQAVYQKRQNHWHLLLCCPSRQPSSLPTVQGTKTTRGSLPKKPEGCVLLFFVLTFIQGLIDFFNLGRILLDPGILLSELYHPTHTNLLPCYLDEPLLPSSEDNNSGPRILFEELPDPDDRYATFKENPTYCKYEMNIPLVLMWMGNLCFRLSIWVSFLMAHWLQFVDQWRCKHDLSDFQQTHLFQWSIQQGSILPVLLTNWPAIPIKSCLNACKSLTRIWSPGTAIPKSTTSTTLRWAPPLSDLALLALVLLGHKDHKDCSIPMKMKWFSDLFWFCKHCVVTRM